MVKIKVNGQSKAESKSVSVHPKRTDIGEKEIWYAGTIYVERIDANEMKIGDTVTFINWGNMKIADVRKDKNGKIEGISADLDLDNKVSTQPTHALCSDLSFHSLMCLFVVQFVRIESKYYQN
ncbi:unnamed protein product [Anisakis simplex]|uniref:Glutamyl/glutaminyl-tRNA synthetase class Ib anti-codon binding domain-containing protein n=1 Tax=Anisakis simplex TaxID=6269 RepID=A0A3P6QFQ1_ANISI|nr:unnamed protein product [Anisakis simplex]